MIFIDTHVALWLFYGQKEEFSTTARDAIEEHALLLTPMSCLELNYLCEVGKTSHAMQAILPVLSANFDVTVDECHFWEVVQEAASFAWTRDPFDRLICSQAFLKGIPLLTRDKHILKEFEPAFW